MPDRLVAIDVHIVSAQIDDQPQNAETMRMLSHGRLWSLLHSWRHPSGNPALGGRGGPGGALILGEMSSTLSNRDVNLGDERNGTKYGILLRRVF